LQAREQVERRGVRFERADLARERSHLPQRRNSRPDLIVRAMSSAHRRRLSIRCDLYGHRRLFLIGLAVFTLASLACGLAMSQTFLIVARAVQGFGGAVVSAVALSLIMTLFQTPPTGPRRWASSASSPQAARDRPRARGARTAALRARARRRELLDGRAAGHGPARLRGRDGLQPAAARRYERRPAGGVGPRLGVVNTAFMMGGALGLAILASLAQRRTINLHASGDSLAVALNGGYHVAFLGGAILAATGAVLGVTLLRGNPVEGHAPAGELATAGDGS
jgi:hypothetical protein